MPDQRASTYRTYEYVIPAEDWEVKPPTRVQYPAEMAYYPHSGRIHVRWREILSNPVRDINPAFSRSDSNTHWGETVLHSETTFYVRGIPEDVLPEPYTFVSCGLTWGKAGGPSMDDPLGQFSSEYDVITITRTVYGRCTDHLTQTA